MTFPLTRDQALAAAKAAASERDTVQSNLLDLDNSFGKRLLAGAAENAGLDATYQQAKALLWTAPCDLEAATAAVNGYQQAVIRLRRSGGRR